MNLLTALEIYNNYPDQIKIEAWQHKETGKWAVFMWRLKGREYHKMMMSSDFVFDSMVLAKDAAEVECELAINWIKETGVGQWPWFKLTI